MKQIIDNRLELEAERVATIEGRARQKFEGEYRMRYWLPKQNGKAAFEAAKARLEIVVGREII